MLPMLPRRRLLLSTLALSAAARAGAQAERCPASAPGAASSGEASVLDLRWTDSARQRTLPLRLRLPAGGQPAVLVLFSHGLGGSVDAGTQWGRAWAQAGIATLHVQHPGSDIGVLREGAAALRAAAGARQLIERAVDVRFVLDELARRQSAGELALARLRLDALGMAGHSFGAHTTLAVAGQNYGRFGGDRLADARPRAFAAFSPAPGPGGPQEAAQRFGGIRRPLLCLSGTHDGDPLSAPLSAPSSAPSSGEGDRRFDGRWRRAVYDALPPGAKAELWLDGADHMSFAGQELGRGAMAMTMFQRAEAAARQVDRHRSLIEAVSLIWWQAHLLGDAAARAALARPLAGLGERDEWRSA